jgi:uncharacterized protein (DUF302 family)
LTLGGAASAAPAKQFKVSETSVVTDHVTIETSTPYPLVKSRLENEVQRFDERFRTLLADNKIKELRGQIASRLEPDGFLIHFVARQGDWLALEGKRRAGNVYYLGDVLAAAQMTKQNFGAALYAPLRLSVYENAHGGTTFEYDKPSSQFGQFHSAEIDKVAHDLDDHMLRLIRKISA